MAVNKVEFGQSTLIDLSGDTVTPQSLLVGFTAHDKSGKLIEGQAVAGGGKFDIYKWVVASNDGFVSDGDMDWTCYDRYVSNNVNKGIISLAISVPEDITTKIFYKFSAWDSGSTSIKYFIQLNEDIIVQGNEQISKECELNLKKRSK